MAAFMRERVRKGAAALDRLCPGWFQKIDLDNFEMDDSSTCVLGYVYGDMYDENVPGELVNDTREYRFGFNVDSPTAKNWANLKRTWLIEIKGRLDRERRRLEKDRKIMDMALDMILKTPVTVSLIEEVLRQSLDKKEPALVA